ncbi:protease I [Kineosphaera limosa]|uniref:Putative peptidase C56 family protein n=1 Tax=Kineosphaera limosa NBRC 100340 TaxID=1184609 RepID=K6WVV5_9MICO|nr:DJ-1/PfpI family protein [Kineosphaera limosa]NYE02630.1 protease I [Kineosphaera limosa]GAB97956.1 putative peptidase C56 family protein [Kineosphaera limosa NBRC 100340]
MTRRVAILIEGDFFEKEIFYYEQRFAEAGVEAHFVSRLWGQESLTFLGHEYRAPLNCTRSFEGWSDEDLASYDALIVPSGMVADRLRYTDDVAGIPPASALLERAFALPLLKGIICHGLWLAAPVRHVVAARRMTCHNNLLGDAAAYGVDYVDEDVVVDGDLISARTGGHAYLLASAILAAIDERNPR